MATKSMLLIINPAAGQGNFVPHFYDVVHLLGKNGFEVTPYMTDGPRHAYQIALERGSAFDYLVCSGGDGTLNEVVDALMLLERRPLLGYIPAGSTNDFAATHSIPTDVLAAAQAIVEGKTIAVDVGSFQNGFFTYVAAFGLFTDVSYGTPQSMKNMLGHAAYIMEGVKKLGSLRHWRCRIELEDEVIEDDFIFGMISNSKSVGKFKLPAQMNIQLDDGMFELLLLRRIQSLEELGNVISVLLGSKKSSLDASFVVRATSKARVVCQSPLSWSVDGEFGGSFHAADIAVHRKAVEIIVPAQPQKRKRRD